MGPERVDDGTTHRDSGESDDWEVDFLDIAVEEPEPEEAAVDEAESEKPVDGVKVEDEDVFGLLLLKFLLWPMAPPSLPRR